MSKEADLDRDEEKQVDDYENVSTSVIFEAIRREGEHELSRPVSALWWSGVAAGHAKGFLASILPSADWTAGVANLCYTVGFNKGERGRNGLRHGLRLLAVAKS